MEQSLGSLPDLVGKDYREVLRWFHRYLDPATYFEIGTLDGATLRLASCASLAVDPEFKILNVDIVGKKPFCALHQLTSDKFFELNDPSRILGRSIDLAFLDGMHRCEFLLRDFTNTERFCRKNSIIILHDCIPVEGPMAERSFGARPPIEPHRQGMWAGDVWRTVVALKRHRPDLSIVALDAPPTGLICITNLDPASSTITERYATMVREMLDETLENGNLSAYMDSLDIKSTSTVNTHEKMTRYFWL
jgi:hypothetical protein